MDGFVSWEEGDRRGGIFGFSEGKRDRHIPTNNFNDGYERDYIVHHHTGYPDRIIGFARRKGRERHSERASSLAMGICDCESGCEGKIE